MATVSEYIAEIVKEREKLWLKAPSELEPLKKSQKGRAGNFTIRLYAFSDGYRNQRNLWAFRELIRKEKLSIATAKVILIPFIQEMADRFEIWQLQTACQLFGKAVNVLDSAESLDDLEPLLDELLIYNNRLWLWIDTSIPWFELDDNL